jgi:hypothetical protein
MHGDESIAWLNLIEILKCVGIEIFLRKLGVKCMVDKGVVKLVCSDYILVKIIRRLYEKWGRLIGLTKCSVWKELDKCDEFWKL